MVLENVASTLISVFLTKYIDKVSTNDLKMSLFSGTASLENLSVKETALMQHQLPFKIIKGIVDKIYVSIPFIHFKSKPTEAQIKNILILGKLNDKTIAETEQMKTKESILAEQFNSIDSALQEQKVSKFDFIEGLIGAIIENLQVKITNIHVRLEYDFKGKTVAIGLIVPLIQVFSIDENWKEISANNSKTMIRKKLILSNLSLYVDINTEHYKHKMKNEKVGFEKLMLDSMGQSHQFILHDFTFETIYEHANPGNGPVTIGNILNITTSAINLALDSFQYQCFTQIMFQQSKYKIWRFYSSCGRPNSYPEFGSDDEDCLLWWRFAQRAGEKKIHPFEFKPTAALVFLKNRNQNLEKLSDILINPNKKKDEKFLKQLQEKYGGDVFLMFRYYAKFRTEKKLREKKHKEMEEMKKKNQSEIDKEAKEIQELLASKDNIKNNADTWYIKLKVNAIDLGLFYSPSNYMAMLKWKSWEGNFKMNKDDINFDALIGDMSLINMKSKERTKIIELIKSEKTNGSATVNINGNLESRIFKIDSHITSPHLFADLSIINDIQTFLSGASSLHVDGSVPKVQKRDHTHAEILNLIDTHSKLFIDLHLDSPVVTVPYKMPIQILLGNVDIKSIKPDRKISYHNKKSWYDEYSLDLSGFEIKLGKKTFCKPVTFSLNYLQSFIRQSSMLMTIVNTKISKMDFDMNHKQYKKLLELPDYITQFVNNPQGNDENENDPQKDELEKIKKKKEPIDKVDSIVSDLSIQLNVDFEEFGLRLFNSKKIIGSELRIAGISTGFKALQNNADGNFVLQYIKIFGSNDKCICNFGDEKVPAINIDVHMEGIMIALSMHTSKPIIDIDFEWLHSLLKLTDKSKPQPIEYDQKDDIEKKPKSSKQKNYNDYQLLRKLHMHPIYIIDVIFTGPTINIPCEQTKIIVDLDLLHIFTKDPIPRDPNNIESFYDNISCEFNKFEIFLGKEYLLDPFSFNIEVQKAFIVRRDVENLKIYMDIHQLKLQLKRSNFVSLLSVVDSVKAILPSSDEENKDDIASNVEEKKPEVPSDKKSGSIKIPKSIFANLKFESLVIELLNEDNSINSSFTMSNLESTFNSFQNDINADLKIVVLKGSYNDNTILSFGENNVPSFNFSIHYNKDSTSVDMSISKPTVLIDFQCIVQLQKFFEISKKNTSKERFIEASNDNKDDNKESNVLVDEKDKIKDKNVQIQNIDSETKNQKEEEKKEETKKHEEEEKKNEETKKYEEEKKNEETKKHEEEEEKNSKTKNNDETNRVVSNENQNNEVEYIDNKNDENDKAENSIENHKNNENLKIQNNKMAETKVKEIHKEEEYKKEGHKGEENDQNATNLVGKEEIPNNLYNRIENINQIKQNESKGFLKSHALKIFLVLIPLFFFHGYIFKHKFLISLIIFTSASLYYRIHKSRKINNNNGNAKIEDNEEIPNVNVNAEVQEKVNEDLEKVPKEEIKEESDESSDEEENASKERAVNILETNALKSIKSLSSTISNEESTEESLSFLELLQKIRGKFLITEPSITMILVKKTKETIRINAKIKELNLSIDDEQAGSFNIIEFQVTTNERYLMKPFIIKIALSMKPVISIHIDLPKLLLELQTFDYQIILEIGEYIPAVLNKNKKQKLITDKSSTKEAINENNEAHNNNNNQALEYHEEEEQENENKQIPFELDLKFEKIELDIYEQEKKLFNFEINNIILSSNTDKSDLTISSIICQEHISSESNTIISFKTPTLVNMSETKDISIKISPDATIFVKMEAVSDLLGIFLPGAQILDYEKQKKIKTENKSKHKHIHKLEHLHLHKHKHNHNHKHDNKNEKDDKKKKSKEMTISVESQCFKVVFLDESEIATLSLINTSYEKNGSNQTIKIFDITLTDPTNSDLYPSQVLGSENGKALSIELKKKDTKIRLDRLKIFANLNVIGRVVNTVVKNPLKLPSPQLQEEEEELEESQTQNDEKSDISDDDKSNIKENAEEKIKETTNDKTDETLHDETTENNKSENSIIVKKDDSSLSQTNSDTEDVNEKNNEKKKKSSKKFKLRFKYISFIIPVDFNHSNEMLNISIDGNFRIASDMKLTVSHITANFAQYNGSKHQPFIPNISFQFIKKENSMDLSFKPTLISIAQIDISEAILLSKSLGQFASQLNLPYNDDANKKDKKKESSEQNQELSVSVEMKDLQIVLNSDRYQTVPLFRFMINEFILMYKEQEPSNIHLVFDSIDFMDIQYLTWKMLLESFSIQISFLISKEMISIDSAVEMPININFAYQAVQLMLSFLKTISEKASLKELISSTPPTFKVVNKSSKSVCIKRIKTDEEYKVDMCTEKVFDFSREEEIKIIIENDSRNIVTKDLQYPIFVDYQAVSQSLQETGTTLTISSILLFDNKTNFDLFLFQQKTPLLSKKLIKLPSGKQTPYTDLESLKTMNFAITTEETSIKSSHSAFLLKDVKRRAILLSCLFPNKKKMKLVVSCKFDPLQCAMIVKIQPNCNIRNQLPIDLYVRSDESSEILHIKPGENVKTTIIDTSGLEFSAYFATSPFGETIEDEKLISDSLKNKSNIKTIDGNISSVPLNQIKSSTEYKTSKICFAIESKKNINKPLFDLVCFAPSIIFNRTGIELNCYNKINDKNIINESFLPREKESDPNQDGCIIWSSEEYFKRKDTSRKLSLQISTTAESERKHCFNNIEISTESNEEEQGRNYMSEDIIECSAVHINGSIMLPTKNKDIFIPLHYTVSSAQPYANSTIVTLTSQFAICNYTNNPFYLQPAIIPKETTKKKLFNIEKSKNNHNKRNSNKSNDQKSEEKGQKIAAEDTETELSEKSMTNKIENKKGKRKKFHFKLHKKSVSKTSDENETETETETEMSTEADEESSKSKAKSKGKSKSKAKENEKKKKNHFHIKSHKATHAKTDNENDTENETEDETTTNEESKGKKKNKIKFHRIHLKKDKDKKNKKEDEETINSDLESTVSTISNDDADEETTSTTQNVASNDENIEDSFEFGYPIKITNSSERQEIRIASYGLLYAFKVDPKSSKYTLINLSEPIHTTFAHEGRLFEIENQTLGVETLIIIKEAIFPQPINLLNDLRIGSHRVYLTQKSINKHSKAWKSKAGPQAMTVVAYDVPFGGTDLILHYKKHKIPINLIHVNTPKKKHHIYYEVIVNENNTKTIIVSKIPYEHKKKANFNMHINIPVISISLIDKMNHEFALLVLQRIDFKFEIGKLNKINFNLGSFQLDDLQPSSILKVVIAAYPDVANGEDIKTKNLLEFSTSMFSNTPLFTACKDLSLKCDPIILFVDLSFLSDLITLMQMMFLDDQSKKSNLLKKPKPAEATSLSSIPLTAETLTINEAKFTIFVRAKTSRPNLYKPVSYFLRAVPDITNGSIILPSFHFEECTMNAAYVDKEIIHPLIEAGIKQGLKLLFNTDIFMRSTGTKSASFAKKGEKLMNGQLQVLVQVPGSILLQGGETGLNVASKFLHNISFNNSTSVNRVNATAKDTMTSGVKALGNGFADAFTGLVKDPMKEKDKKGVGGVFIGIGKGLLGLVTKPISGILDASMASISAMRKAMNGEDADVIPPIRIAHALPMTEMSSMTSQMMVAKDVSQMSFQMSDISELYNQYVERLVIDEETSNLFGITQEYFFSADKDGKLEKKSRIKNITDIQIEKKHIISMTVNEISIKTFELHFKEEDEGIKIMEMINSRRIALGIGE